MIECMKYGTPILGLLVIFGLRYALTENYKRVATAVTSGEPRSCIKMIGLTTTEEKGTAYIIGTVRNDCGYKIGNVSLAFKADRDDSNRGFGAGTIVAYAHDVPSGGTQGFKAQFPMARGVTYRLDGITAF